MAAYDIYSQIGRGVRSVADYDREAAQLEGAKLANQANQAALLLNRQKADEYTRGIGEQNRLRELTRGWGAQTTDDDRIASLKNAGFFGQADALEKGLLERQKTGAEVSAKGADVRTKEYELGRKRYENRLNAVTRFTSADDAKQWLADGVTAGDLDMKEATRMISQIPGDPQGFGDWQQRTLLSMADAGKQAGFIRPDANAVLTAQTSAANNAATNERMAREGALNRGVQMRGQDVQLSAQQLRADLEDEKRKRGGSDKPMPAAALKLQQEALDAIGTAESTAADIDSLLAQVSPSVDPSGRTVPPALELGPVTNLSSAARNALGMSTTNSKNYASARATLEKLRNDSLRLNKGVQTEGDSQRAWNELLANLNDQGVVQQRLAEIKEINERASLLHQANVGVVRQNYGLDPLDIDAYLSQRPVVGAKKGGKSGGAQPNPLGASSRVGGQAPRPAPAPTAPAAAPAGGVKFLGFEPGPGG